jgi:hypothetical protein
LNQDFLDMLSALSAAGAEFLVVGAHALAAHGYVRATGDLDIWVRPTNENAERVWQAVVHSFRAPHRHLTRDDFCTPNTVVQIGVEPNRVDILTSIAGVEFDECWPTRKQVEVDGLLFYALGPEALLKNKRAAGRPKDLNDVAWLEQRLKHI